MRGIAILGILLANIFAFGWLSQEQGPSFPVGYVPWIENLRVALVSGKFRALLAMLFGFGLHLQFSKAPSFAVFARQYVWRSVLLLAIGLMHGFLLWYGDILGLYGLTAIIAILFVRLPDEALITISALGLALLLLMGLQSSGEPHIGIPPWAASEVATFQGADFGQQIKLRLDLYSLYFVYYPLLALELIPLFLIGILLGRYGVLVRPGINPAVSRTLAAIGAGGLLINLLLAMTGHHHMIEAGPHVLLAIGYAIAGAFMVQRDIAKGLRKLIVPVGRMALSCYLLQTLAGTFIFYGWGLGQFARLDYLQLLGIVPIIWGLDLAFAHLWLRFFRMGPVEWVWRTLARGRNATGSIQIAGGT